ncbi:hypothetical protein LCGC14_0235970 [marine sediment metagenome]|uniref:Phage capsid-like C-terminal domain-containing protein n=1 Tax=marine sediment metagenome TaxID=412755 RepID=A0A0F9WTU9_9ZZZZ
MKKSELDKLIKAAKSGLAKATTVKTETQTRKSGGDTTDPADIQVTAENLSLIKYIGGVIYGDLVWKQAPEEEKLFKALGQDAGNLGGVFVPPILSTSVIGLLKDKAVVRNMPGVGIMPVTGTDKIEFNSITEGPAISWGSEASTINEDTGLGFGRDTLELKKMVCLYKMSSEILRNARVNMEDVVRNELARELALEEDLAFLEGPGGQRPLGIYYQPRVLSTDLSAAVGVDNIKDAMYNVRLNAFNEITGWVMHPRTQNDLDQLKDANGRYLLTGSAGIGVAKLDNIFGAPLKTTTKISVTNRPSSGESYIVGGIWSELLIGDGQGFSIKTSEHVYFTTDQIGLRLTKHVGSMIKHGEGFVVIKGIST